MDKFYLVLTDDPALMYGQDFAECYYNNADMYNEPFLVTMSRYNYSDSRTIIVRNLVETPDITALTLAGKIRLLPACEVGQSVLDVFDD